MFYAEYNESKSSLNLTLFRPNPTESYRLDIGKSGIEYKSGNDTHQFELVGLSVSCITCKNLKELPNGNLSCTFHASSQYPKMVETNFIQNIQDVLLVSDFLLCKFCQLKILCIEGIKSVDILSSTVNLDDASSIVEGSYFCHQKNSGCNPIPPSFDISFQKNDINALNCDAALNGTELILHPKFIQENALKEKKQTYLHCSCCLMVLGKKVSFGNIEHRMFWTNCLSVLTRENDGDFPCYIEKPLITDETDFYALLIANLVENEHYRIILSAITWDGCMDFMLLWLLNQEVRLYTSTLCGSNSSVDITESTSSSSKKTEQQQIKPTNVIRIEPVPCRRVFYHLLLPNSESLETESFSLLNAWKKDFGVSLVCLPWETCIGLAACLSQYSTLMAPQTRKLSGKQLMGFTYGAVPLIHHHKEIH